MKYIELINILVLKIAVLVLPWLAPIPSAVFIAVAAHDVLEADWITAIIIGIVLDGFGVTAIAIWTRFAEYNSRKEPEDPFAPTKKAGLLVLSYIVSAIWLTAFLKIVPVISEYNPQFVITEKILLAISYAIFPLITLSGAAAISLNSQHDELLAKIAKERADKLSQEKKLAEKEARRLAKLERDAEKLAQLEKKVAEQINEKFPVAIPVEYTGMISKKLANNERYLQFFAEQVKRNGNGMMPVEEIVRLTGVPKKTAYNYMEYYKRDTGKEKENV